MDIALNISILLWSFKFPHVLHVWNTSTAYCFLLNYIRYQAFSIKWAIAFIPVITERTFLLRHFVLDCIIYIAWFFCRIIRATCQLLGDFPPNTKCFSNFDLPHLQEGVEAIRLLIFFLTSHAHCYFCQCCFITSFGIMCLYYTTVFCQ